MKKLWPWLLLSLILHFLVPMSVNLFVDLQTGVFDASDLEFSVVSFQQRLKGQTKAVSGAEPTPNGQNSKPANDLAPSESVERSAENSGEKSNSSSEEIFGEGSLTSAPRLLKDVKIPYPPRAKKANVEGAVMIEILISALGEVKEARVISGPGFDLNEAALEAVKQMKFQPARVQNQSVAVRTKFTYRFTLDVR